MRMNKNHIRGCIIGGAIGDALGCPIEFMDYNTIIKKYGPEGIKSFDIMDESQAKITDDTQMTIFTIEGLLRANARGHHYGLVHIPSVVYNAYIRWLHTQQIVSTHKQDVIQRLDGWVSGIGGLKNRRGPGKTCLTALETGQMGTIENRINNSKGCGGVMRSAPVGLLFERKKAFTIGCEIAAITHGHPSGYLPAGVLAYMISGIMEGMDLYDAVIAASEELSNHADYEECLTAIRKALELVNTKNHGVHQIQILGEGWIGEEALAISIYCSLAYQDDFRKALCLAVNHDGDSDSTGAITGNILGAYLGYDAIPPEWRECVEFKEELLVLADDLFIGFQESETWWEKYPGW